MDCTQSQSNGNNSEQLWGIHDSLIESLAQTDSQALKRSELEGFSKKWQHTKYPLHLAMYILGCFDAT